MVLLRLRTWLNAVESNFYQRDFPEWFSSVNEIYTASKQPLKEITWETGSEKWNASRTSRFLLILGRNRNKPRNTVLLVLNLVSVYSTFTRSYRKPDLTSTPLLQIQSVSFRSKDPIRLVANYQFAASAAIPARPVLYPRRYYFLVTNVIPWFRSSYRNPLLISTIAVAGNGDHVLAATFDKVEQELKLDALTIS